MEDKTQYEALVEELQKIGKNFKVGFTEIGEILSKILPDVEIPDEEEDTWEMKCPYKYNDSYYYIAVSGNVSQDCWCDFEGEKESFEAGNIFKTKQAALLEAKRRNLLTRFRAFRDECNNGWKPDWTDFNEVKFSITHHQKELAYFSSFSAKTFDTFGYFKKQEDCERAIELFGDEIKKLFVEG